jgi:hypothetical protein
MRQPEGPCYSVEPAVGGRIMYERLRPPQPASSLARAAPSHHLTTSSPTRSRHLRRCTAVLADSDEVADTPNQLGPNFDKTAFPRVSCPLQPNGDTFMNYMDYVDDAAMFMFTAQQVVRMHQALALSRPQLGVGVPVEA